MTGNVAAFGEVMLRLSPPSCQRLVQAVSLDVEIGGSEANVAATLTQLGHSVIFVTRLPEGSLGDRILHQIRRFGIDTRYIVRGGDRAGLYFLEQGASVRPSKVIYDRAESAMAQWSPGMIDWETVFRDQAWFHISGITPALSPSCAEASLEAVQSARRAGLTVSCDLNYRAKLWDKKRARDIMTRLVQCVDVIIANEQDASDVFGIEPEGTDVTRGVLNREAYADVAQKLARAGGASTVAVTLRESRSASDNRWSAVIWDGQEVYFSRVYDLHLVDRVGAGDAFCGGLIHGLLKQWPGDRALEFGVAAAAWKQTLPGDMNYLNEAEILALAGGDVTGRIRR